MINKNQIVPVTKADLLTLYGTFLNFFYVISGGPITLLSPEDDQGNFVLTESSGLMYFCNQPVKSLNIDTTGPVTVYFVAAYDFGGLTVAGAAPTFGEGYTNDTIIPDCVTLFSATLHSGTVTVTAVTPVSE